MSQPISETFLDSCRQENGFYQRGEAMTRIEVFVDAAFAFAITMLVISIDEFPKSVPELIELSKSIPAFVASVFQITWIWHSHSVWSRRYGLENTKTVLASVALVIVVLIYIYPLRMMFSGLFAWLSDGYLPSDFVLNSYNELRFLFVYFAAGFLAVSLIFVALNRIALGQKRELRLTADEIFKTQTEIYIRYGIAAVALLAMVSPFLASDALLPFTGFTYALIGVVVPLVEYFRQNKHSAHSAKLDGDYEQ